MSAHNRDAKAVTFDDHLREKLEDDDWRRRWGGEEVLVRLGYRVYRTRTARGLSQAGLAELAGTQQPNISAIENAEANPTVRTVGRIAAALEVDPSDLFEGSASEARLRVFVPSATPQTLRTYDASTDVGELEEPLDRMLEADNVQSSRGSARRRPTGVRYVDEDAQVVAA